MAYVFNGPDKVITFDVSTVFVDVQDLWSRYVDWLTESDNSKYLPAMRIVGGDTLPGSKQLGITYFMLNGWKIRPYEESHVLTIDGNIYSEDGSSPFTAVLGSYNVTIINTVSNLVDSTVQQLPQIEHSSFGNTVTLDVNNGVAGTLYPIGTPTNPVNNIEDAIIIANYRGFRVITILSNLTLTTGQNVDEFVIRSSNWLEVTVESGVSLVNTEFEKISLYGVMGGYWNVMTDCWVYDITNFCGWLRGGSFVNVALAPYTVESAGQSFFDETLPMYPDAYGIIIMNTDTSVAMSDVNGLYQINNCTDGCSIVIGLDSGEITIDSSCTGGSIVINGVGHVTNNSNIVIMSDALLSKEGIGNTTWDLPTSEHQIVGSTGKALTSAGAAGDPWISDLPGSYISGQAGFIMAEIQRLTEELHRIQGLDINNPMTVTPTMRTAGDIDLELGGDGENITIVTRK